MSRTVRTVEVLVAATALLLSGCVDVDPTANRETQQTEPASAERSTDGSGGPGDLLPDGGETDQTANDKPTGGDGGLPELGAPGIPACDLLDLPATALPVIDDIEAGGPYDYPRNDGVRFQNREGILPDEDRDYYREFTVETPGLDHRGPRRIVTGGFAGTDPDQWFYTDDHYESFCEFDPDGR